MSIFEEYGAFNNKYFVFVFLWQEEVKRMTYETEQLKKTMAVDKERLHSLEAALDELHRKGRKITAVDMYFILLRLSW